MFGASSIIGRRAPIISSTRSLWERSRATKVRAFLDLPTELIHWRPHQQSLRLFLGPFGDRSQGGCRRKRAECQKQQHQSADGATRQSPLAELETSDLRFAG